MPIDHSKIETPSHLWAAWVRLGESMDHTDRAIGELLKAGLGRMDRADTHEEEYVVTYAEDYLLLKDLLSHFDALDRSREDIAEALRQNNPRAEDVCDPRAASNRNSLYAQPLKAFYQSSSKSADNAGSPTAWCSAPEGGLSSSSSSGPGADTLSVSTSAVLATD